MLTAAPPLTSTLHGSLSGSLSGSLPGSMPDAVLTASRASLSAVTAGPRWLDPQVLLSGAGAWPLVIAALIVFAECGVLLGFLLPGDSLLFTAGLLVATGALSLPLWVVCATLAVAAVLGNLVGYACGRVLGPALLRPGRRRWPRPQDVERTHAFFDRHGARAIVLARFVPIVRTLITVMAGVGAMPWRRYFAYSSAGGLVWAAGVVAAGDLLGRVTVVRDHLELFLLTIVAVSVVPVVLEVGRARVHHPVHNPVDNPAGQEDVSGRAG